MELRRKGGSEVFDGVESAEKKHLLDRSNISDDHIFHSREGSFVEEIIKMNDGKGIDVGMSYIAGKALRLMRNCIVITGTT